MVLKSEADVVRAKELTNKAECILEKWVPFEKEISVIVIRSVSGETKVFPVAENIHVNNILHESIVPARITEELSQKAIAYAKVLADELELVGTLAVEMFATADGEIYINELAPRPHNSGHYTQDACETSQFGQHIRAICNLPLGETNLLKPVVMVNILGEHIEGVLGQVNRLTGCYLHLYGKEEAKLQRKMGHVNILNDNIEDRSRKSEEFAYLGPSRTTVGGKKMINRYTRPEMGAIWTEENKFKAWLEVEILACEAWAELGDIPKEDVKKIREHATFDIDRIYEIEKETRHDVVAFTRAVSETPTLGEERKWVHYGLTSTDVVDTALSYILKQANEILLKDLENFVSILANKAKEHKYTIMMGRTHGVHAEPTTFGLKLGLWYEEMKRNVERFKQAADTVRVGKLSGAVGTYANIDPFVEKYVCENLGLEAAPISTQTLQRDRHAHYMSTLALIATSVEKMAVEIRGLQKSETREVEEAFAKGQKGSSAMPHKRNPIGSENMTGLARVIRGYMMTAYENVPLWHERDISHSSAERVILPDATIALNYMLNRFGNIVKNLTVFPENMKRNMDKNIRLNLLSTRNAYTN